MSQWRKRSIEPRKGDMPKEMVKGRCEAMLQTPDERWTQCQRQATNGRMCSEHHAQWKSTWGQT